MSEDYQGIGVYDVIEYLDGEVAEVQLSEGDATKDSGTLDSGFGFTVTNAKGEVAVYLPHQCGEWVVASDDDPAIVARYLSAFIAEAQRAREVLLKMTGS